MPAATINYIIGYIEQNIPPEILNLAFKPQLYNTSLQARIIAEIVEGPILLDTNLVGGKRRDIFIRESWRLPCLQPDDTFDLLGSGYQGVYYKIPPEAREHRNISSVIGISPIYYNSLPGGATSTLGGGYSVGNTASTMMSATLNTRTFAQYPIQPLMTLEGTNIIRTDGLEYIEGAAVSVFLEYDSEFLNMNQSGIFAMRNLCLCATQRYISTNLRVPTDETEIVAGMEIGVIKDLIVDYATKAESYQELLIKLKGAMTFDPRSLSRMIYHAL